MRTISQKLLNLFLMIFFISLLYWAFESSAKANSYQTTIIELASKLFLNETIESSEYPQALLDKKYKDTVATESLVKVSADGYKYFHTPSLFFENWQILQPGQILSLLLIADPSSESLVKLQKQYIRDQYNSNEEQDSKLCVIVTNYNNQKNNYKRNLESIMSQDYSNYKVIFIDDASTDNSFNDAKRFVEDHNMEKFFTFERNSVNKGSLENHYIYIQKHCKPNNVVVSIDGDDHLIGPNVFRMINNLYKDKEVWVSSSQTFAEKENNIWMNYFPEEGIKNEDVRKHFFGHLKTFLAGLFMKINTKSFINPETGTFFKIACDRAMMYPMVEMAGPHYRYLPQILYFYNDVTHQNNHALRHQEQLKLESIIKSMKRYGPVTSPY